MTNSPLGTYTNEIPSISLDVPGAGSRGVGMGVTVGFGVGRGVFVSVAVGSGVSVTVAVGCGVSVGFGVGCGVFVSVAVGLGVLVDVAVGCGVSVDVDVDNGVFVSVAVGSGVSVAVAVGCGVSVGISVGVGDDTITNTGSSSLRIHVSLTKERTPIKWRPGSSDLNINHPIPTTVNRVGKHIVVNQYLNHCSGLTTTIYWKAPVQRFCRYGIVGD